MSLTSAAALSMAVPQVVAMRTARMLAAGANPNARDRRELERMGTEKVLAYWESMNAMSLEMARQWWSPWVRPWSMAASATRILEKGLRPVQKRASANARRLRKSR